MHCVNNVILLGMGKGDDFKDDSLDVYYYFNSSCYSGFFDDDNVCILIFSIFPQIWTDI